MIDDKLQGSVATYLKSGGVVNNQIKKGLLLTLSGEYLEKLQARKWLSCALCARGHHTAIIRSTQPCIPPGSLNRVPASAGLRAGMSPLPGGR